MPHFFCSSVVTGRLPVETRSIDPRLQLQLAGLLSCTSLMMMLMLQPRESQRQTIPRTIHVSDNDGRKDGAPLALGTQLEVKCLHVLGSNPVESVRVPLLYNKPSFLVSQHARKLPLPPSEHQIHHIKILIESLVQRQNNVISHVFLMHPRFSLSPFSIVLFFFLSFLWVNRHI